MSRRARAVLLVSADAVTFVASIVAGTTAAGPEYRVAAVSSILMVWAALAAVTLILTPPKERR